MTRDNKYTSLIVRWLTGANSGESGNLYVTSRGKGTSLFMRNLSMYTSHNPNKRRKRDSDVRIAIFQNGAVRVLTATDSLGIADIADRLGIEVIPNAPRNFKADGTIKNGIIDVR